jgi:hypothetical protein
MAKLVIDISNSPDDYQEIEVEDFAEATWNLVADLVATSDDKWSMDVLREWLKHIADLKYFGVQSPDKTAHEVVKNNSISGEGPDTTTFRYDPS